VIGACRTGCSAWQRQLAFHSASGVRSSCRARRSQRSAKSGRCAGLRARAGVGGNSQPWHQGSPLGHIRQYNILHDLLRPVGPGSPAGWTTAPGCLARVVVEQATPPPGRGRARCCGPPAACATSRSVGARTEPCVLLGGTDRALHRERDPRLVRPGTAHGAFEPVFLAHRFFASHQCRCAWPASGPRAL